jgi:NADH-quinone oxidoreductase subunit E
MAQLTKDIKKEIKKEFDHYPHKQAACLEALKVVQDEYGWVSDEAMEELAEFLEMSSDELESVATFYNLIFRKPVGENVILVCDSISCWVMENQEIIDHLKEKLDIDFGQTTEDDKFTLLPIPCLGTCDHAPAMMVNPDLHRDLTPEKVDNVLVEYRQITTTQHRTQHTQRTTRNT